MKLFPSPRIPTRPDPGVPAAHQARRASQALPLLPPTTIRRSRRCSNGPHPETGEDLMIAEEIAPEGAPPFDLPSQTAVFAPGPDPEMLAEVLGQPAQGRRTAGQVPPEWSPTTATAKASSTRSRTPSARGASQRWRPATLGSTQVTATPRPYPTRRRKWQKLTHLDEKLAEVPRARASRPGRHQEGRDPRPPGKGH